MARKKVREYNGKRLLKQAFKRLYNVDLPIHVAQAKENTNFHELLETHPWLNQHKLVVKPDMLFGQRGKNDLVGLNLTFSEAEEFIRKRMGKQVTIKGCTGPVTTFVIEPFVPHEEEYYLCIQSNRLDSCISFSPAGGVEIEENWDKVKSVRHPPPPPARMDRNAARGGGGGEEARTPARTASLAVAAGCRPGQPGVACHGTCTSRAQAPQTAPPRDRPTAHPPPGVAPAPQVCVPAGEAATPSLLAPLLVDLPLELKPKMETFVIRWAAGRGRGRAGGRRAGGGTAGGDRQPPCSARASGAGPRTRAAAADHHTHPAHTPPTPRPAPPGASRCLRTWTAPCWR